MLATLDHIEKLNSRSRTFWFSLPTKLDYIAGQYIEMSLPHHPADDRGTKHWFTLSSSPTEPLVSITTKFSEPSSSFKSQLNQLKIADKVNISMPMGDFVLPKDRSTPLVYVAGGIGITPVRSMVKSLTDTNEKRQIRLIYAANKEEDLIFRQLFKDYGLDFMPIISNPTPSWTGLTGKIDGKQILTLIRTLSDQPLIYISGPEPMVEALVDELGDSINKNMLVTDYFPGYKDY